MSTTSTSPMSNPQKRKRTVVSYAQPDQLAELLGDDEDIATVTYHESSDDESDNDDRTYSRHKKLPKKTTKNKKARHSLTRQQPEEKPFPFMELPPELRDMIYEMALIDEDGISIVAKTKAYRRTVYRAIIHDELGHRSRRRGSTRRTTEDGGKDSVPKKLVPNLLAVSKQIYNETVNILYGQEFTFQDTDALHRFLGIIGLQNQQRLHHINLNSFCTSRNMKAINHCAFMTLAGATNLKTLVLNNYQFRYYSCAKGLARGLFMNMHFFLEAYGAAHGRMDAGIDVIQLDEDTFDSFYVPRRSINAKQPLGEENEATFRAELCRLLGMR